MAHSSCGSLAHGSRLTSGVTSLKMNNAPSGVSPNAPAITSFPASACAEARHMHAGFTLIASGPGHHQLPGLGLRGEKHEGIVLRGATPDTRGLPSVLRTPVSCNSAIHMVMLPSHLAAAPSCTCSMPALCTPCMGTCKMHGTSHGTSQCMHVEHSSSAYLRPPSSPQHANLCLGSCDVVRAVRAPLLQDVRDVVVLQNVVLGGRGGRR